MSLKHTNFNTVFECINAYIIIYIYSSKSKMKHCTIKCVCFLVLIESKPTDCLNGSIFQHILKIVKIFLKYNNTKNTYGWMDDSFITCFLVLVTSHSNIINSYPFYFVDQHFYCYGFEKKIRFHPPQYMYILLKKIVTARDVHCTRVLK